MARVVVVGGGISGVTVAYRLEQLLPDTEVIVLEQGDRLGGTIGTVHRQGFVVEEGPNGFLDNNPAARQLCQELGLGPQLVSANEAASRNRFLFLRDRIQPLPTGLFSFLTSGVLSWKGKLNLLWERFRAPGHLEDESIDAFARRRAGDEVAETLADAFVTGILAGDPRLLSLPATFPRLAEWERVHGSLSRGMAQVRKQKRREAAARGQPPPGPARMWSFREGLHLLIDTLGKRLRQPPRLGVAVQSLHTQTGGESNSHMSVVSAEQNWQADAVVLACPGYQQTRMLANLDAELAQKIGEIAYNRVAVVALGYPAQAISHRLDGFGYLTPQRDRRDVLGVQWCSSIYPGRAPSGMVLLRALCGGWNRPDILDWDDARLLDAVSAELRVAMGISQPPVFHHLVRWQRAIPQYHVGHCARVGWIEERQRQHPGLFLGGNCYRGVAINDCVEQAGVLAQRVAAFLGSRKNSEP
jgi:oxygen-dependent protoporphyrinogen oxidase